MAKRTERAVWVALELDSGELARVPGANDEGAAARATNPARPVALFQTERAVQRFLGAVFGAEAGKEWRPGRVSGAELDAIEEQREGTGVAW